MGTQHPWAVQNLEEFLYYCCPECNERNQSEELFFIHALESHPHSKEYILPFKVKSEENETLYSEYDVKLEASEYDTEGLNQITAVETKYAVENDELKEAGEDDFTYDEDFAEHEMEDQSDDGNDDSNNFSDTDPKPKKKIKKSNPEKVDGCFQSGCDFKTKKRKPLMEHLETAHEIVDVESLTCKICNNKFHELRHLFDHLGMHFKQKSFKCDVCDKEFLHTQAMRSHKRHVHSKKKELKRLKRSSETGKVSYPERVKIPCMKPECSYVAFTRSAIMMHMGEVHNEVDYKAKMCLKCNLYIGGNHGILFYHMKRHYERVEFFCAQCGKTFKDPYQLRNHESAVHTESKWHCDKCGKNLKTKESLEKHQASVHDKIRYQCDKCEKCFAYQQNLRDHVAKVHEGKQTPKIICTICGKKYEDKQYLKRHIAVVHDKLEAGLKCEECDKTFDSKAGLKNHIRFVHRDERNHICKICKGAFKTSDYLKKHIATVHDGIRSFQCDMCEKAFSNIFGLTRHKQSFHQGIRFECDKCSKSFTQQYHLKTHLKQDHRE